MAAGAVQTQIGKAAPKRKTYSAPALEKGLDILELLASTPDSASLSEIAGQLKRSVGEIFRMLAVLEQRQYVAPAPDSDKYQLTMKLFQLAHMHLPINVLVNAAAAPMRRLAQRTGQSCHLGILDDAHMRVIARQESFADLSFSVRVGTQAPVFQSCSGNVLYAFSDDAAREGLRDRVQREAGSEPGSNALDKVAAKIRRQGYLEAKSGQTVGITDIGYPVFDHSGSIAAALSIPFVNRTAGDPDADRATAHAELALAAAQISRVLGASPPPDSA
jgi:DNA-binding IclR family transcriptional regulator